MWDLIVSVPDHCLSFYLVLSFWEVCQLVESLSRKTQYFKHCVYIILKKTEI